MVGEGGRELVQLPFGSKVFPHGTTEAMLAHAGEGRGGRSVLEIRTDGTRLGDFLIEILRKSVIQRGGNVQVVFGGRA